MKNIYALMIFVVGLALNAQPTTSAPTPPERSPSDVFSIFSDAYTNWTGINYNPGWGQSGSVTETTVSGTTDNILFYSNCNYQGTGWEANPYNGSGMEYLHLDIWIADATGFVIKVTPIDQGGTPSEFLVEVPVVSNAWNSVDLPKADFGGMAWNNLIQMKFDCLSGTTPANFYIDNMYFWKEASATGTDATLSDLQIDGVTVPGFSASAYEYSYGVEGTQTAVPQITLATPTQSTATVMITQATSIPGDATVAVTSTDGTVTDTYTVSFFYNSPATAAPEPTDPASEVISLFSDVYTDVTVDTWRTDWSNAVLEDTTVDSDPVKKYTSLGFVGVETVASPVDASSMMYLNFSAWTPNMTDIKVKLVDFLGDGYAGGNGDTEAELTIPLTQNEWNQIQIPLSDFTNAGMTSLSDINQYIFSSIPFGIGTLYLDNVYFTNVALGTEDIEQETSKISFYPNPVISGRILSFSENTQAVDFFDLNGKKVLSTNGNEANITLPTGVYLLQITDENGKVQADKLIVK